VFRRRARPGERIVIGSLAGCALASVLVTVGIIAVLASETLRFFAEISPVDFFTGTQWAPSDRVEPEDFGVLPLINGTLMIVIGAVAVGMPLGVATAVYMSEYARPRVRSVLKPVIEVLAGIPSVVVGFFALNFITPSLLRPIFGTERVFIFNAASGAIAVGLMILPFIASISEDVMRSVPQRLRDGAYAMGASRHVVALRVVIPAALSGIAASVVLGASRAVGETMAVTLAAGNTPRLTVDFFESIQTLTAYVAQTVGGEVPAGTVRYQALFAVGSTLFVITLVMNIVSVRLVNRFRQVYE
jgi:phosphate transport system permease protein